jgi:hypothetical protein
MNGIEFTLQTPIPYINTTATKCFFNVQYPSGYSQWELRSDDGSTLKTGGYTFPQNVLNNWTISDDVLISNIYQASPWIVIPITNDVL